MKGEPVSITSRQKGNVIIGKVVGNEFVKKVSGRIHFLRKPPAIAFDVSTLVVAKRLGARVAHVIDKDTNTHYYAPISVILEDGIHINRGFGEQVALAMKYWTNDEVAYQPSLFSDGKESHND